MVDDRKRRILVEKYSNACEYPLLSLDEFFEGNDDEGSIGCNLTIHPGIFSFRETLKRVAARPDVRDVLVQISEIDPGFGAWPFSDTVFVIGEIDLNQVKRELAELHPDEVVPLSGDMVSEQLRKFYADPVICVWWD